MECRSGMDHFHHIQSPECVAMGRRRGNVLTDQLQKLCQLECNFIFLSGNQQFSSLLLIIDLVLL